MASPADRSPTVSTSSGSLVDAVFRSGHTGLGRIVRLARQTRSLLERVDPEMERLSAVVCVFCQDVCCINRHGHPAEDDLIYLRALGIPPPPSEHRVSDTSPCRFLGAGGCTLSRAIRPYRCTWYFCDPLILLLNSQPAKATRTLEKLLLDLSAVRCRMLEAYNSVAHTLREPEVEVLAGKDCQRAWHAVAVTGIESPYRNPID